MRINKFLALKGVASRRGADILVASGKVRINGRVVKEMGFWVNEGDRVEVDGKTLGVEDEKKVYYLVDKPKGVVTTTKDTHGREVVTKLIPGIKERLYPVGRLDKETSGLLLLTNDGNLAYRLTHPKFQVEKIYVAKIAGDVPKEKMKMIKTGVRLSDGFVAKAKVTVEGVADGWTVLSLMLTEGKKRQIRLMCEKLRLHLVDLRRVAMGMLRVETIPDRGYRQLTEKEVETLKKSLGI